MVFLKKISWLLLGTMLFSFDACLAFDSASEMTDYFEPYMQTGAYLRNGQEVYGFLDCFSSVWRYWWEAGCGW